MVPAKVILQGRKYGLGSFVVTQRTANISKSILNQCNTIFALRVFDDTGKQFLEKLYRFRLRKCITNFRRKTLYCSW